MHGTKVDFMRDILSEAKSHLRQNEVNHMEVPHYQEISVKNLYEDAMKDEVLAKYLPTKEQLSGRLPLTRILLRAAVHTAEPVHEGHHRGGTEGPIHGRRGSLRREGHFHLGGMDGRAAEAPLSLK